MDVVEAVPRTDVVALLNLSGPPANEGSSGAAPANGGETTFSRDLATAVAQQVADEATTTEIVALSDLAAPTLEVPQPTVLLDLTALTLAPAAPTDESATEPSGPTPTIPGIAALLAEWAWRTPSSLDATSAEAISPEPSVPTVTEAVPDVTTDTALESPVTLEVEPPTVPTGLSALWQTWLSPRPVETAPTSRTADSEPTSPTSSVNPLGAGATPVPPALADILAQPGLRLPIERPAPVTEETPATPGTELTEATTVTPIAPVVVTPIVVPPPVVVTPPTAAATQEVTAGAATPPVTQAGPPPTIPTPIVTTNDGTTASGTTTKPHLTSDAPREARTSRQTAASQSPALVTDRGTTPRLGDATAPVTPAPTSTNLPAEPTTLGHSSAVMTQALLDETGPRESTTSNLPAAMGSTTTPVSGDGSVRTREVTMAPEPGAAFADRLARFVLQAHDQGQELSVRITPPDLGSIVIDVRSGVEGLQVRLEASSAATQQLLTDRLPQLHESLQQLGRPADRVEVVRGEGNGFGGTNQNGGFTDRGAQQTYQERRDPPPPSRPEPVRPTEPDATTTVNPMLPGPLRELNIRI
jgi:hypothetical protein